MENNEVKNIMNGRTIYRTFDGKALAILPCKCGATPVITITDERIEVSCPNCTQYVLRDNIADAIEEWNRRNI